MPADEALDHVGVYGVILSAYPGRVDVDATDPFDHDLFMSMPPEQARTIAVYLLEMARKADSTGERGPQLHTLAQLAVRAGLSDGRVRAMWAEDRTKLPEPTTFTAGGQPLWFADIIDNWLGWRRQGVTFRSGNEEETGNDRNPHWPSIP